jgi:hypothetical protein
VVFIRRKKERLLLLIDRLYLQAEIAPLSDLERKELREANEVLAKLRRDEEIKWAQITKVKHIQEEGNNTKYFHLIVNEKHCQKNMLAIMIARAKEDGQVDGLIPHLVDVGISILQYVDDTIIFMEHDLEKALNMKLIRCILKSCEDLN